MSEFQTIQIIKTRKQTALKKIRKSSTVELIQKRRLLRQI